MKKTLTLLLLLAGLTLDAQAETLTWNGSEGQMTWNTDTENTNWMQGETAAKYTNGFDVVFGDIGSGEVVLDGTLKPGSVLVEAGNDYIFSGEGKLSGKMTLTKNGSGTLTINTANDYSGGTIINSGTLVLGHDKALGSGNVTLGSKGDVAATLDLNKHSISNKITLEGSASIGNGTVNNSISLGYDSKLVLCGDLDGTDAIIMGQYSFLSCNGHILNKDVIITATPTFDLAYIDAGTINGSISVGEDVEMDLQGDLHGTGTVTLEEGASLYCDPITATSSFTLYKDVTLTGSAYLFSASIHGNVTVSEGKCLSLKTHNSRIAGTITLCEGASLNMKNLTLTLTDGSVVLSGSTAKIGKGAFNGSISVGENQILTLIGDLSGEGSIGLGENAQLNLDGKTLSKDVSLTGDATIGTSTSIGTGTLNSTISVEDGKCLDLAIDLGGEGSISLGDKATLDLLYYSTLSTSVSLTGDSASIGNGTFNGSISVDEKKTLTLMGNLSGEGSISLGDKATLDLNENILSNSVSLAGDSANIGNGTINGSISVGGGNTLTLTGKLSGTGSIFLGANATLDLNENLLSNSVSLAGDSANIGNGTISGSISVGTNNTLTLFDDLDGAGIISLGDNATLDLGTHSLANSITLTGDASVGNGTYNGTICVGAEKTLTLHDNLEGTGNINLSNSAMLDLGTKTTSTDVIVDGSNATITNGTITGKVTVEADKSLFLKKDVTLDKAIILDDGSTLDMDGVQAKLSSKFTFTGQSATIDNATLVAESGETVTLTTNLSGSANISLGDNADLNLDGHSLSNSVSLAGNSASIGNGRLNGDLSVAAGKSLSLSGYIDLAGAFNLGEGASLDLGNQILNLQNASSITFSGSSARIGSGMINGTICVGAKKTLTLTGDLSGDGSISVADNAMLDLNEHSISNNVIVGGNNATVSNGTIGGNLILAENVTFSLDDPSLQLGGSIILGNRAALDLYNLSISNNVIVDGSNTTITKGTITGKVTVAEGKSLFLKNDVTLNKAIILDDGASLDMDGVQAKLSSKFTFTGQSATIDNATMIVEGREKVTLTTNLSGSANISMGRSATLDLNKHTLSNSVTLAGDASIGNGTLDGCVTIKEDADLTLTGDLDGTGCFTFMNNYGRLNLGGHKLSIDIAPTGNLEIGSGTFNGTLTVDANNNLYLFDNIFGSGSITLRDNTQLFVYDHSLSSDITVEGNASIGVSIGSLKGNITVNAEKTLTLNDSPNSTGSISLGDNAALDLAKCTISQSVSLAGDSAKIGNGTIKSDLSVGEKQTLTLIGELSGEGRISLEDGAMLNLGNHSISNNIIVDGSNATISNGTITGNMTVAANKSLLLQKDVVLNKAITLGDCSTLDMDGMEAQQSSKFKFTGQSATINNATLIVESGETYTLTTNLSGSANISIGVNTELDLNDHSLSTLVTLNGDAGIGNGEFNGTLYVGTNNTLTLFDNLDGAGNISLGDNAILDLKDHTLSGDVTLTGTASILSGTHNGSISVEAGKTLYLTGNLDGEGSVNLAQNAKLDLLYLSTLSKDVTLTGSDATISNGTVNGNLTAKQGASARLSGATIKAGATTVKSLDEAEPGLLKELSVSGGLIAGTGRASSLADGLAITSESDLMIKSMTMTADNKISVGEHTITLQDVTIKISDDVCSLLNGIYTIDLKTLINCDLKMQNVLLDASDLTLPQDFDLAKDAVAFDFGTDVTIQQATGLDMRLGDYWSSSLNLDTKGQVIFTKLAPVPEPATGTLSLLALAALAARRRRK